MTTERLRTNRPDRQADSHSANNHPLCDITRCVKSMLSKEAALDASLSTSFRHQLMTLELHRISDASWPIPSPRCSPPIPKPLYPKILHAPKSPHPFPESLLVKAHVAIGNRQHQLVPRPEANKTSGSLGIIRHPCAADCKTRLDIENPNSDMLPNASSCSNQFRIKGLTKSAARSVSSHHQNASTCCWLSAPPPPMPQPLVDTWNHPQRYITSPGKSSSQRELC